MKHLPILISITIIALLTNACKYECPGFDKSLLSWMPQNEGDTLNYINENTDTLSFVVEKKNYSKSFKIERQNKKSCYSYAILDVFNTYTLTGFTIKFNESYSNNLSISFTINIDNKEKYGHFNFDNIKNLNNLSQEIEIDNKSYKEAIIFESDTINNSISIYKAIAANNYGLVKFYEKSGVEWSLLVD